MKINLPTTLEVEVSDKDLLSLLKKKRLEMLEGAEYAEADEENGDEVTYWLWVDNSTSIGKPTYKKSKQISKLDFQLLESMTHSIYFYQQKLEEKEK